MLHFAVALFCVLKFGRMSTYPHTFKVKVAEVIILHVGPVPTGEEERQT